MWSKIVIIEDTNSEHGVVSTDAHIRNGYPGHQLKYEQEID